MTRLYRVMRRQVSDRGGDSIIAVKVLLPLHCPARQTDNKMHARAQTAYEQAS